MVNEFSARRVKTLFVNMAGNIILGSDYHVFKKKF